MVDKIHALCSGFCQPYLAQKMRTEDSKLGGIQSPCNVSEDQFAAALAFKWLWLACVMIVHKRGCKHSLQDICSAVVMEARCCSHTTSICGFTVQSGRVIASRSKEL